MGNTLKNVSLVILLLKMCLGFTQEDIPKKRIIIDPGHGGKDSGAIGVNGIMEKDVVLNIAEEIVRLNKTVFESEYDIYLTRYRDTLISLSDRTELAKKLSADVFISLHCNHSDNPKARGVEVYVSKTNVIYSKESILLAYEIQKGFKESLEFESRGVKFEGFQVLRETIKFCPTILLELGFLSNWDECNYYQKPEPYRVPALVILRSLIKNIDSFERVRN